MSTRCAVVIATRDRPARLRRALAALATQTHPRELIEVIVVDDGSTPAIESDEVAVPGNRRARVLRADGSGPAAARNLGAGAADCDLLLFTDDDAVPTPTWVSAMAAAHHQEPGAALGGPSLPFTPRNPYAAAYNAIEDAARIAHERDGLAHLAAANLALPRDRFAELGGFNPAYRTSEDRELAHRWLGNGWPVRYCGTAVVAHAHPETLGRFWRTFVRYGQGAHMFHHDRRRREGKSTAGGLRVSASTLLVAIRRSRSAAQLLLIGVWLLATVSGFTQGALRSALPGRRRSPPSA